MSDEKKVVDRQAYTQDRLNKFIEEVQKIREKYVLEDRVRVNMQLHYLPSGIIPIFSGEFIEDKEYADIISARNGKKIKLVDKKDGGK